MCAERRRSIGLAAAMTAEKSWLVTDVAMPMRVVTRGSRAPTLMPTHDPNDIPPAQMCSTAGYLDARFAGALLGSGSWPGDITKDEVAVARARSFFDLESNLVPR